MRCDECKRRCVQGNKGTVASVEVDEDVGGRRGEGWIGGGGGDYVY